MRKLTQYDNSTGHYYTGGLLWLEVDRIFTSDVDFTAPPIAAGDDELIALTSQTAYTQNGIYRKVPGVTAWEYQEILFDGILIRGLNWEQAVNLGQPNLDLRPLMIAKRIPHFSTGIYYWQFDGIQNAHPIAFSSPGGTISIGSSVGNSGSGMAGAPTLNITLDAVASANSPDVRVLVTTNIANITTITGTGAGSYDGVSIASGDILAVAGQTTATENDLWQVGATGVTWNRIAAMPTRGMRFYVREGTFTGREFAVTQSVVRTGTPQGMLLRRIDGSLMTRAGADASIGLVTTRTHELLLPRMYVGAPSLTGVRTYTLPSTGSLLDGTEIIIQFETSAPNAQISIVPFNTGAGERINGATSYTFTISAWRRAHVIFRGGNWFANQFS